MIKKKFYIFLKKIHFKKIRDIDFFFFLLEATTNVYIYIYIYIGAIVLSSFEV